MKREAANAPRVVKSCQPKCLSQCDRAGISLAAEVFSMARAKTRSVGTASSNSVIDEQNFRSSGEPKMSWPLAVYRQDGARCIPQAAARAPGTMKACRLVDRRDAVVPAPSSCVLAL